MDRVLITGIGGFIGSTLAAHLLAQGSAVLGIDCLTDYYEPELKRANLDWLRAQGPELVVLTDDLHDADLAAAIELVDVVFHIAGQPGVRASWGEGFDQYVRNNVSATSRLLDTVLHSRRKPRVVYASSSSIYGRSAARPVREDAAPQPRSPYGVTKLAAEHLCSLFAHEHGLDVVSLRLFTVFGPRQRPDMAVERIIRAGTEGTTFTVHGDGTQTRDFTFVGDVARAFVLAGQAEGLPPGFVCNVSSGEPTTLREVIETAGEALGTAVNACYGKPVAGDPHVIRGDNGLARASLGWAPQVSVREGVFEHVRWARRSGQQRAVDTPRQLAARPA